MKARFHQLLLISCLLWVPLSGFQQQYPGTVIRGRLLTVNNWGQQVPLVSARVELFVFNPNIQQLQLVATSFTDMYGNFGFNYVNVNYYTIWVNGVKSYNIQVVYIDYRFYQYQNLGDFYY